MNVKQTLGLAMSGALIGTALGCAPSVPNSSVPAADIPASALKAQDLSEGAVHPDQLIQDGQRIMVGGQPLTVEQLRKELPSRISEADAAKLLVEIDPSKVIEPKDQEIQQRGRGFGRGYGRGFARGFGRGFYRGYGRGFYGGYGRFRYYGHRGYYFPYYNYAGYYYPYYYPYYSYNYYPYFYGYRGYYYPYRYWY